MVIRVSKSAWLISDYVETSQAADLTQDGPSPLV